MAASPEQQDENLAIVIDGKSYTTDELTFKEQRTLRQYVRQLTDNQDIEIADTVLMDLLPALVTVIKQRDEPGYTLEQALDLSFSDVLKPAEPSGPTGAGKTRSTPAASGTRAT